MAGALSGVQAEINELWDRKIEVDEALSVLEEQIRAENLTAPLGVEIERQKREVSNA